MLLKKATKQELADSVSKALSDRASEVEVVEQGEKFVCYATFESAHDLQQRKELLEFLGQRLRDMGVFTKTRPTVTVSGKMLIVRFADKNDFRNNAPLGGVYSIKKDTGEQMGPYPDKDINPLFHPPKPRKQRNNRNNRNRSSLGDYVEDHSYTPSAAAEKFSYDELFNEMWTDVEQARYDAEYNINVTHRDVGYIEDYTITAPKVKTRRIYPSSVDYKAMYNFINSFGRVFQNLGSDPKNARKKSAYHHWLHFSAALGLVAQTEVIGAMDRLQNDSRTSPCSMVWIANCLAGQKDDPDIQVSNPGWYKSAKKQIKGQTRFLCNVKVNNKAIAVFQLNKSVQAGFYCHPDRDNRPAGIKVTEPLVTTNGHYAGLSWV